VGDPQFKGPHTKCEVGTTKVDTGKSHVPLEKGGGEKKGGGTRGSGKSPNGQSRKRCHGVPNTTGLNFENTQPEERVKG